MHTTTGSITKCQNCHGSVYNVGKTIEQNGREPWLEEPSCGSANCHGPQFAEEPGKLFRQSKGHGGLFCTTCHSSPHAIVPTTEPRDNVQNIALQGFAGTLSECSVCHGYTPAGLGPHGIPAIKVLQNVTVANGQSSCYNATQTISVAGNGTTFNVGSGGSATLIAGRSISFLPGTTVNSGGYLWGYITSKGRYCGSVLPPMAPQYLSAVEISMPNSTSSFVIYPNPNPGEFALEMGAVKINEHLKIRVFNFLGREIPAKSIRIKTGYSININDQPNGIYLVRVVADGFDQTEKVVKQ
jgi:hypothetical protein